MNLEQYDKWVIANQKKILDWTRKFDKQRYAPIRDAFSNYHNAKSNKQRIASFEKLKDELKLSSGKSFNELIETTYTPTKQKLQRVADDYTKGDIDALDRNSNFAKELTTYDELSPLYESVASIPSMDKDDYSYVELDKAYEDHYNNKELAALADRFGYDYKDKADRSEFLHKLAQIQQQKDINKIWNEGGNALFTNIATPIMKDYAEKNWKNINADDYVADPVFGAVGIPTDGGMLGTGAVDVGINTLMAGIPGKAVTAVGGMSKPVQFVARTADNVTAPAAKAVASHFINDVDTEDAAKNAVSEILTNIAASRMLNRKFNAANKYVGGESIDKAKVGIQGTPKEIRKAQNELVQDAINKHANKAHDIQSRLKSGALYRGDDNKLYQMSKDGKSLEFNGNTLGRDIVSNEDYNFYLNNKKSIRGWNWGPKKNDSKYGTDIIGEVDPSAANKLKEDLRTNNIAKIRANIDAGLDPLDGMDVEDLALSIGKKPKETKFNWMARNAHNAANSEYGADFRSYLNNLQGKTKWGGYLVNLFNDVMPYDAKFDLSVKERLNQDDPELEFYRRLKKLHDEYKDYYPMLKMPEKYKKFKDDITIQEIFGDR